MPSGISPSLGYLGISVQTWGRAWKKKVDSWRVHKLLYCHFNLRALQGKGNLLPEVIRDMIDTLLLTVSVDDGQFKTWLYILMSIVIKSLSLNVSVLLDNPHPGLESFVFVCINKDYSPGVKIVIAFLNIVNSLDVILKGRSSSDDYMSIIHKTIRSFASCLLNNFGRHVPTSKAKQMLYKGILRNSIIMILLCVRWYYHLLQILLNIVMQK